MQKRTLAFFVVAGLIFFVGVNYTKGSETVRDLFLRERNKFFELYGGEQVTADERILLKKSFGRTQDRMLAAILRLQDISARLKIQIAQHEDNNLKTRAMEMIIKSDGDLQEASSALEKATSDFENLFMTENPGDAFHALRYMLGEQVVSKIYEAHTTLLEAASILENSNGSVHE